MSSYLQPVYGARTDAGRQREQNEDCVHAGPLPGEGAGLAPWFVFAVADGVGGHRRGEWASQTAITTLTQEVKRSLGTTPPPLALRDAFLVANATIWDNEMAARPPRAATTLVAALIREGTLWWANVGDSRAYLARRGKVIRLSQDHSWVEEQVRAGYMTREEARISGRRNVITRSIGGDVAVQADVGGPILLRSGDVLILCSDGLHSQVSDDELGGIVQQLLPEAAAERLVALSNDRGGPDNISVIVCLMFDASSSERSPPSNSPRDTVTRP